MICDILDIDYEDIKDKLPKGEEEPEKDITDAENLLNGAGVNGAE